MNIKRFNVKLLLYKYYDENFRLGVLDNSHVYIFDGRLAGMRVHSSITGAIGHIV